MNEKTIKNLTITLLVIIAIYSFMRWQQNRSFEPAKPKGFEFSKITSKNTESIEVKSADGNYKLVKKDGKWTLEGLQVQQSSIDELFKNLKDAEVQTLAATKKERLAQLEVDDEAGKNVTFVTKNKKYNFIIGKQDKTENNFYVRLPKSKKAYLASSGLATTFSKSAGDWYDKQIISLSQTNVEKVEFSVNELVLSKTKGKWSMNQEGNEEKVDSKKVDEFLSAISQLTATNVEVDKGRINFDDADTVTLIGKKSRVLATVHYKSKGKKELYVKNKKKKDFLYTLDEFGVQYVRKKPKDFK